MIRDAVPVRAPVEGAVTVDHEVDLPVAVDVAQQRDVTGEAAEVIRRVRDAVLIQVDRPHAGRVGHDIGDAIAVHVRGEHEFGRRRELDSPVGDAILIEIEEDRASARPVEPEVERQPCVRRRRDERAGAGKRGEKAGEPERQEGGRIVREKDAGPSPERDVDLARKCGGDLAVGCDYAISEAPGRAGRASRSAVGRTGLRQCPRRG